MDDEELCDGYDSGYIPGVLYHPVPAGLDTAGKLPVLFMGKCGWKYADSRVDHLPAEQKILTIIYYIRPGEKKLT